MTAATGGSFSIDVLVIGAGAQGSYVADALSAAYSVCLVTDPDLPPTTLDGLGLISAGYTGNDPVRMQPARRTAGYWRQWADSNGIPGSGTACYMIIPPGVSAEKERLWSDASLHHAPSALPPVLTGGTLGEGSVFLALDDVVVEPAAFIRQLNSRTGSSVVSGKIVRFALTADVAVDQVEVDVDGEIVFIAPRFVVLAAGVGNASLLAKVAGRFRNQELRKSARVRAHDSQAVADRVVLCVRGPGLPLISGTFGALTVVAHRVGESDDIVWLVSPTHSEASATLGPSDPRFDHPIDQSIVADLVDQVRCMSPMIAGLTPQLSWAVYSMREAVHPVAATAEPATLGTPVSARLDDFGLEGFLALWPSHLGYTMLLGDVVAERVAAELGDTGEPQVRSDVASSGLTGSAWARGLVSRWNRPDFRWWDWATFARLNQLKSPDQP